MQKHSIYSNTNAGTVGLRCSGTNRLLTSDFGSSIRGERQFLTVLFLKKLI